MKVDYYNIGKNFLSVKNLINNIYKIGKSVTLLTVNF